MAPPLGDHQLVTRSHETTLVTVQCFRLLLREGQLVDSALLPMLAAPLCLEGEAVSTDSTSAYGAPPLGKRPRLNEAACASHCRVAACAGWHKWPPNRMAVVVPPAASQSGAFLTARTWLASPAVRAQAPMACSARPLCSEGGGQAVARFETAWPPGDMARLSGPASTAGLGPSFGGTPTQAAIARCSSRREPFDVKSSVKSSHAVVARCWRGMMQIQSCVAWQSRPRE